MLNVVLKKIDFEIERSKKPTFPLLSSDKYGAICSSPTSIIIATKHTTLSLRIELLT